MPKVRDLLVFLLLLSLSILCYGSVIPTYFLSDDFELIGGIARHQIPATWGIPPVYFRPGTDLSFLLDCTLWGLNPVGYHLTNILFHGVSAFALFLIARHYFRKVHADTALLAPCLTAALFVVLASHSESVSWIAGRTDVIAVALGLTGTVHFLFLLEHRSYPRAILSLLFLAAAFLTKESVLVLPVVWTAMYFHDWYWRRERPAVHASIVLAASFLLLGAYFLVRRIALGTFIGGYGTAFHMPDDLLLIPDNLTTYLFRTFLPPLPVSLRGARVIALCVSGVLILVFTGYRKRFQGTGWPFAFLLGTCCLLALAPVIRFSLGLYNTQAERFLYLPSAFACLLLVHLLRTGTARSRFGTVILLVVVVIQAGTLQWVNTRWITASRLTWQIAREVASVDPAKTAVLNIPDNYCGAYVFRRGLDEATTLFLGRAARPSHAGAILHDVTALDDSTGVHFEGASIMLTLPHNVRSEAGFQLKTTRALVIIDTLGLYPGARSLLSFTSASSMPMMREVLLPGRSNTGPTEVAQAVPH